MIQESAILSVAGSNELNQIELKEKMKVLRGKESWKGATSASGPGPSTTATKESAFSAPNTCSHNDKPSKNEPIFLKNISSLNKLVYYFIETSNYTI